MSGIVRGVRTALGWRRASNIGLTPVGMPSVPPPPPPPPTGYIPALKFNDARNSQYIALAA